MSRHSYINLLIRSAVLFPAMVFSAVGAAFPSFISQLPIVDTLDVFLGSTPAGSLIGSLKKTGGAVENSIRLSVEVDNQTGIGKQRLMLEEVRRYDTDGALRDARQEMRSAAGTNSWHLTIDASGGWWISVTTAGVTANRQVKPVAENISTLASLYGELLSNTLRVGMSWIDTSIELTSGEPIFSETRCSEAPSEKNDRCWVFVCSNNVLQRREIWKVDRRGKTVYRDMYPYIGRKKGASLSEVPERAAPAVSLFEMMKVKVPRAPVYGRERVAVSFDNNLSLDTSVAMFFSRRGTMYVLNTFPKKCSDTGPGLPAYALKAYLAATPTLQTNHPKIKLLADSLHNGVRSACEVIAKYNRFVHSVLRKQSSATFSSALETLEAGYGDCGEHAVLLAALLRASNVPARVVAGLLYVKENGGYFYHAWVMAYTGKWVFADPSHNCFPAYRDRIPLVIDDDGTQLVALAKVIGRTNVTYVEK